jgi:hypothetical protein
MRARGVCNLTRLLGGLVALAGVLLLAPGEARAVCGRYVLITNPTAHPSGDRRPDAAPPMPDHGGPTPCQGPACSGVPAGVPPGPVSEVPTGGPEWALLLAPPHPPGQTGARPLDDADSRRPIRRAADIFHPPRLPA